MKIENNKLYRIKDNNTTVHTGIIWEQLGADPDKLEEVKVTPVKPLIEVKPYPGYGYLLNGDPIPDPPDTHELCPEGEVLPDSYIIFSNGVWMAGSGGLWGGWQHKYELIFAPTPARRSHSPARRSHSPASANRVRFGSRTTDLTI